MSLQRLICLGFSNNWWKELMNVYLMIVLDDSINSSWISNVDECLLDICIVFDIDSISYWYDSFDWERIISYSSIEDNWRMLIMIVYEIDAINSSWLNLIDEYWWLLCFIQSSLEDWISINRFIVRWIDTILFSNW